MRANDRSLERLEQNGMSMAEEWIHLAKRPSEAVEAGAGGDERSAFVFRMMYDNLDLY